MKSILLGLAAATCLAAGPVAAQQLPKEAQDLMTKNACNACHTVDKKLVGPSFQEVADKYRGNAGAEATLVSKVQKGGQGVWGAIPMPPSTADVKEITAVVKAVLALPKK